MTLTAPLPTAEFESALAPTGWRGTKTWDDWNLGHHPALVERPRMPQEGGGHSHKQRAGLSQAWPPQ